MEAKDTVIGNKKLQLLGQQYEDDVPTYDLNHYLLLAQAEVSFKAGREQEHKVMIGIAVVVHHKNGVKDDNRIENLQLVSEDRHNQLTRMEWQIALLKQKNKALKEENKKLKKEVKKHEQGHNKRS